MESAFDFHCGNTFHGFSLICFHSKSNLVNGKTSEFWEMIIVTSQFISVKAVIIYNQINKSCE